MSATRYVRINAKRNVNHKICPQKKMECSPQDMANISIGVCNSSYIFYKFRINGMKLSHTF